MSNAPSSRSLPLHPLAIILGLLLVCAVCVVHALRVPELSSYWVGSIFGRAVALIVVPLVITWIISLISRRSKIAVNVAFLVTVGLACVNTLIGDTTDALRAARDRRATEAVSAELRDEMKRITEANSSGDSSGKSLDEIQDRLARSDQQLKDVGGDDAEAMRVSIALGQELLALVGEYKKAGESFEATGSLEVAGNITDDVLAKRLKAVDAMEDANNVIIKRLHGLKDECMGRLPSTMPKEARERFTAGFMRGVVAEQQLELRASQTELIGGLRDCLTLLRDELGQWTPGDAGVTFRKPAAGQKFEKIVERLGAAAAREQAAIESINAAQRAAVAKQPGTG